MMGLVLVGEDAVPVPTWAAAVFSIRVAGLLTYKQSHFQNRQAECTQYSKR